MQLTLALLVAAGGVAAIVLRASRSLPPLGAARPHLAAAEAANAAAVHERLPVALFDRLRAGAPTGRPLMARDSRGRP
jgi:hypothetical protein